MGPATMVRTLKQLLKGGIQSVNAHTTNYHEGEYFHGPIFIGRCDAEGASWAAR
jgi:hypothetical protein